jgi:DNA-binding response OmpR family regulator
MAELGRSRPAERPRVIVLMACTSSIQHEARQVNLGADCVLRDPLRIEVLFEYLARYRTRTALPAKTVRPASPDFEFAGVHVAPHELLLTKAKRQIRTTPRVVELLTLLHRQTDRVAPYALIYSEVFGRRFTGDTSNCRVLVAKTAAAFQRLGVNLRSSIDVVPKSGYRYRAGK